MAGKQVCQCRFSGSDISFNSYKMILHCSQVEAQNKGIKNVSIEYFMPIFLLSMDLYIFLKSARRVVLKQDE